MAAFKDRFLFALSFLTIFKVNVAVSQEENIIARSSTFFPLVGAILGIALMTVDILFSLFFPSDVSAVAVLTAQALLTAGLHYDGFADTIDGLGAFLKGGRERALEVMRDSRSGSLGVLGLVLLVLLKYSMLVNLAGSERLPGLFLMPAVGRWFMVLTGKVYPYARPTSGLGQGFAGQISYREVIFASLWLFFFMALGSAVFMQFTLRPALCLFRLLATGLLIGCAGIFFFASRLARYFGGMTGDTTGAVNEVGEVLFLLGINLVSCY